MISQKKIFSILTTLISTHLVCLCSAQTDGRTALTDSVNSFAVNLLKITSEEAGDGLNVALSPYTVWTLLTIISEGARGDTLRQIDSTLTLPKDKEALRNAVKDVTIGLLKSSPGVSLEVSNAIFTTMEQKLNTTFQQVAKKYYDVDVIPTNFKNTLQAVDSINSYVSRSTKGRIENFIIPDDVMDALIFLTSTMHFKGQWTTPFNKSATTVEPFYDELGNELGTVNMMYQTGNYPYTRIDNLKSFVVELPYGKGDRASMIVLLPYKDQSIATTLKLFSKYSITQLMNDLSKSAQDYPDEDVFVYLPKFKMNSDFNLNIVLQKMGIKDVFNINTADLLGMFPHYLYVRRIIQKAEIEVNEEGTEASAAAGAGFGYKTPSPKFQANKPFLYFIVDKPSGCVIFAGKITNPLNLQSV